MQTYPRLPYWLACFLLATSLQAKLEISNFFGDHMVLQRDQALPVWGTANPGAEVTVRFRNSSARAQADRSGKWMAELPAQKLGKPGVLRIDSGDTSLQFEDVLVGEVWIGSGQSNMQWRVSQANNAEAEIAAADYPMIRLFEIPERYTIDPADDVDAQWSICSPQTISEFSAVSYYFGRELFRELQIPIGLVSSNWGGTPAESWTPIETLKSNPAYEGLVQDYRDARQLLTEQADLAQSMQASFDAYNARVDILSNAVPEPEAVWFDPGSVFEGMQPVESGVDFLAETNGLVHVRTIFNLSPDQAKRAGSRIRLGQIDNFDVTWINGVKVGATGTDAGDARRLFRDYAIPEGVLKPGKNVVLLQIVDIRNIAHFGHNVEQPEIVWPNQDGLSLADGWAMKLVEDIGVRPEPIDGKMRDIGSFLWNGMIAPIVPAAFRGVIWYQGESNTGRGAQYRTLFPDMIRAWRSAWGQGDFPFYFVQLANFEGQDGWPEVREAQLMTLELPNTGMAVTIDIGDPDDIHPRNKQDVGQRLALWALAKTYEVTEPRGWLGKLPLIGALFQQPIAHSGPLFHKAQVEEASIRIHFDHANGGLQTRDGGPLKGFTIAQAGGSFKPAQARIDGDTIVLTHPGMDAPQQVRYAWAINPEANLVNGAGLPASPFRTDDPIASSEPEPAAPATVAVAVDRDSFVPDEIVVYKTVDGTPLSLRIFNPEGHSSSDQRPAIVFFHGGGWSGGNPNQFYPFADHLASKGMVAISAQYRLTRQEGVVPSDCVEDGKSAIRWVRQHAAQLGIDPNRIAAGGGSAGGHIAAAAGNVSAFEPAGEDLSISSKPNSLVLFNPVANNGPGGYGHDRVQEYWEAFSPMHNIDAQSPPTIFMVGDQDHLIPVSEAQEYQRRMQAVGRRCELHIYEGEGHGFFNLGKPGYAASVPHMDAFLASLGYLDK